MKKLLAAAAVLLALIIPVTAFACNAALQACAREDPEMSEWSNDFEKSMNKQREEGRKREEKLIEKIRSAVASQQSCSPEQSAIEHAIAYTRQSNYWRTFTYFVGCGGWVYSVHTNIGTNGSVEVSNPLYRE